MGMKKVTFNSSGVFKTDDPEVIKPLSGMKAKEKKSKKLKLWCGRSSRREYRSLYVAAYSQKQAREIIETTLTTYLGSNEISEYFSPMWGTAITQAIRPTKPCLFAEEVYGEAGSVKTRYVHLY